LVLGRNLTGLSDQSDDFTGLLEHQEA
jgi:hypothetical protein